MRGALLLLSVAAALCGAVPDLEPVTCSGDGHEDNAVRYALHHINRNHAHGYKFQKSELLGINVQQNNQGCVIVMRVNLQETKCDVFNPQHFEDCEARDNSQTVVMAGCVVVISVQNGVPDVLSHKCETTKDEELPMQCPDCPGLLHLDDEKGLTYVASAISYYNMNNATGHYFVLRDVGRISSSYIMGLGMNHVAEFVMVETHCPVGTRITPEACSPLCPQRARHVFCKISRNSRAQSTNCETYPALDQSALEPGQNEPLCPHPQRFSHQVQCTEGPANKALHPICSWIRPAQK